MNLEQLTGRFENVASQIAQNNSEHFSINNSLYNTNDLVSDGCSANEKGTNETGILIDLQKVLYYIEFLAGQQHENITKTSKIVYRLEECQDACAVKTR